MLTYLQVSSLHRKATFLSQQMDLLLGTLVCLIWGLAYSCVLGFLRQSLATTPRLVPISLSSQAVFLIGLINIGSERESLVVLNGLSLLQGQ